MPIEVRMPKLSDTMEAGTIIRWLKRQGDSVAHGEPLAEVETDKADVEIEASETGILREIRVNEGDSADVGDVIAVLSSPGEGAEAARDDSDAAPPKGKREAGDGDANRGRPQAAAAAKKEEARSDRPPSAKAHDAESERRSPPSSAAPARETPGAPSAVGGADQRPHDGSPRQAVRVSPLAARMASESGVDLSAIRGTGPGGRIVKRDVEELLQRPKPAPAAPSSPPPARAERKDGDAHARDKERPAAPREEDATAAGDDARGHLREQSRMRLTIARRMAEANREIPHFYVTTEVDMSDAVRMRQSIKDTGLIPGLTLTHMIIKAVALALTKHPRVNASWRDGAVEFHDDVNVGVAVAVEDGLIVPVVHRAQQLDLAEISVRTRTLTERARSGRFSGPDLTGATFSVSNLGILDVDEFTAVISPPQAAILAVGAVKERPIVRDGQLAVARTMRMTLSCDHRVLNGVEGGQFLEEVKRLLAAPILLVMAGAEEQ